MRETQKGLPPDSTDAAAVILQEKARDGRSAPRAFCLAKRKMVSFSVM